MSSLHRNSMLRVVCYCKHSQRKYLEKKLYKTCLDYLNMWISVPLCVWVCLWAACVCRPVSCEHCWEGRISSLVRSEELDRSCWASIREQCSVLMPSIARRISPTCRAPHLRKRGKESDRGWCFEMHSADNWVLNPVILHYWQICLLCSALLQFVLLKALYK